MAFATIDVTKGITGTIPVANGGTGLTSGLSYQTGDRVGFGSGGSLSYENLKEQFENASVSNTKKPKSTGNIASR